MGKKIIVKPQSRQEAKQTVEDTTLSMAKFLVIGDGKSGAKSIVESIIDKYQKKGAHLIKPKDVIENQEHINHWKRVVDKIKFL